jgi:hypothetical protein
MDSWYGSGKEKAPLREQLGAKAFPLPPDACIKPEPESKNPFCSRLQ